MTLIKIKIITSYEINNLKNIKKEYINKFYNNFKFIIY